MSAYFPAPCFYFYLKLGSMYLLRCHCTSSSTSRWWMMTRASASLHHSALVFGMPHSLSGTAGHVCFLLPHLTPHCDFCAFSGGTSSTWKASVFLKSPLPHRKCSLAHPPQFPWHLHWPSLQHLLLIRILLGLQNVLPVSSWALIFYY